MYIGRFFNSNCKNVMEWYAQKLKLCNLSKQLWRLYISERIPHITDIFTDGTYQNTKEFLYDVLFSVSKNIVFFKLYHQWRDVYISSLKSHSLFKLYFINFPSGDRRWIANVLLMLQGQSQTTCAKMTM